MITFADDGVQNDIDKARLQMYQEVPGNPTRSVLKIYEVVRNEYASKLDRNRKVFIISVQVSEGVFIPVCFALLPDKKRSTYDAMFGMLREALETRGLELSAEYFMSDFETAIRDSFVSHFSGIQPKGCIFHFSKAIISKVQRNGFKSDYTSGNCPDFSAFIRAILGLGYVPLPRFREGIRNLYVLAKRLTGP